MEWPLVNKMLILRYIIERGCRWNTTQNLTNCTFGNTERMEGRRTISVPLPNVSSQPEVGNFTEIYLPKCASTLRSNLLPADRSVSYMITFVCSLKTNPGVEGGRRHYMSEMILLYGIYKRSMHYKITLVTGAYIWTIY